MLKEELRATKKAFRDVVRRAREEQRDKRRARKTRRRLQARRSEENSSGEAALDGRVQKLSLDGSIRPPARSQTMPISQAALPQRPVRSETSSEMSVAGVIHTPSSASQASALDAPAEAPDKKGRLKGLLKSRKEKKQQKSSEGESSKKSSKKDLGDS